MKRNNVRRLLALVLVAALCLLCGAAAQPNAKEIHIYSADDLVQLLAVAAALDGLHHDVLGRHERKLCHEVLADNLRIYHETINDVQVEVEDTIDGEEALRYGQTLVCGVIEGTLEPLCRGYQHWIHEIGDHVVSEGGDTLGTHRVSLICHGR